MQRKSGDSVSCSFPNVSLVPLCPRQSSLSNQIALSPLKRKVIILIKSYVGKACTSNSVVPKCQLHNCCTVCKKRTHSFDSVKLTSWLVPRFPIQCERTLFPASFASSAGRKNIMYSNVYDDLLKNSLLSDVWC